MPRVTSNIPSPRPRSAPKTRISRFVTSDEIVREKERASIGPKVMTERFIERTKPAPIAARLEQQSVEQTYRGALRVKPIKKMSDQDSKKQLKKSFRNGPNLPADLPDMEIG